MKLPARTAGLPGNVLSFYIVPLDPAYKAGVAGHFPVRNKTSGFNFTWSGLASETSGGGPVSLVDPVRDGQADRSFDI